MIRRMILATAMLLALALPGCGGGGGTAPVPPPRNDVIVDIPSLGGDWDGDLTWDPVLFTYSLSTNAIADNVFAGTQPNPLDPGNPASDLEYQGYLTFPITSIPPGAQIVAATVTLQVQQVIPISPATSVTLRPDLVVFPRLDTLVSQTQRNNVFLQTPLLLLPARSVTTAGVPKDIFIDVTDALLEAGSRGFSTMQLQLGGTGGRLVIDDLSLLPLLTVTYR